MCMLRISVRARFCASGLHSRPSCVAACSAVFACGACLCVSASVPRRSIRGMVACMLFASWLRCVCMLRVLVQPPMVRLLCSQTASDNLAQCSHVSGFCVVLVRLVSPRRRRCALMFKCRRDVSPRRDRRFLFRWRRQRPCLKLLLAAGLMSASRL